MTSSVGWPRSSPSSTLRPSEESQERLLEVPAEVDLGTGDPVLVVEAKNLSVSSPPAPGDVAFVGDHHLVARLDQPDELEVLAAAGPGPATLEVAVAVELRVRWGGKDEVIAQALFEEAPVAGCKRGIGVANDLLAVGDGRPSLTPLPRSSFAREAEASESPDCHGYGRFLSIGLPVLEVPVAA